ncbi:uncharacterized protein BO72DRAFT_488077 [Aspergillus fijiensis CBS 313.89]|uniref:Uncharacterized protein n=1 Tax=Aspergillus fijiensis CBS 313.89 TaxID=1448319 RepID=A0A8G1RJY0_9EURO|nr:uncharacterized protein BO72DRAFT_488077 [Aspergillus fijiensis CBS 313.89]RAK74660.1 hypothetical protein BO72DRAFT_488077 [Aspergillus fijiensis CBS 313.89]
MDGNADNPRTPSPSPKRDRVLPSVEFTFSCSPSSAGGAITPTSSVDQSSPRLRGSDRRSITPTAQSLFETLRLSEHVKPQEAEESSVDYTEQAQRVFGLSPTPKSLATTYRDLHNATPSPAGPSSRRPDQQSRASTPASPLEDVKSNLTNLNLEGSKHTAANASDKIHHELVFTDHVAVDSDDNATHDDSEHGHSDDDDDEDDDDDTSRYNVRQEELPRAPIYDIQLQNALRNIRGQLAGLAQQLGRRRELVSDSTTMLHQLYEQALKASRFAYPATRTVGFIGDSGMGKSSLINSILDQEGLARSSGDGAACTTVVTEFRSINDQHPQNYTVEADFMDKSEIRELLEELLSSVRKYYTDAFREVQVSEEKEDIKAAALRAWETLRSLFPHQKGFDLEFLSKEGEESVETVLTTLQEWAMAGLDHRPGGRDNLRYSVVARHADECMEQLDNLMADPKDSKRPALWPFVKLIRVYLRSPVLRTGLVLADLPGFRDLNYARVRATERYLRHSCDEVFVVSSILRCTTDQSIGDIIQRCARDQPIRIVCTRSEDVDAKETARSSSIDDAARIRNMDSRIERLESRIRSTRSRRRRASGSRGQSLAAEETDLSDQKDALQLELNRFLITRRNTQVTDSLLAAWGSNARVFCVSNKLYADHRFNDIEEANGYRALSGITELRRYCQSVPADAQFRATVAYIKNDVPALLGSIHQWVLAGSSGITVARAELLRGVLVKAETTLERNILSQDSEVRRAQGTVKQLFNSDITRLIQKSRSDWCNSAVNASREWALWHHMTYAAFCRNYGSHQTGKQPYRCWNEEILGSARDWLILAWDVVLSQLEGHAEGFEKGLSRLFREVCESIAKHQDLAPESLQNLLSNIRTRQRCLEEAVRSSFHDLVYTTEKVKADTIHGHSSSYIAGVMRPVYNICQEQYGTGSDSRRKGTMNRSLSSPTLFMQFASNIAEDYHRILNQTFDELDQRLRDEIANITRDLRASVTVEGEVSEAGQNLRHADKVKEKVEEIRIVLDHAQMTARELAEGMAS